MEDLLGEALAVLVVREQLAELVLEDRGAARLHPDDRGPGSDLLAESLDRPFEIAARQAEEAVVVQWPSAADVALRDYDAVAGGIEHLDRGDADAGVEAVVEGVRPEEHGLARGVARAAARDEPVLERPRREGRQLALLSHPRGGLGEACEAGRLRDRVHEPGCARGEPGRLVDQPERVRVARP